MREVCFIIDRDGAILRIYYGDESAIPDSQSRWNVIWEFRERIAEIVHTHPGEMLRFSEEDRTTMQAVEAGTGLGFRWSVVTRIGYMIREGYAGEDRRIDANDEPWWTTALRDLSFGAEDSAEPVKPRSGAEGH